MSNEYPYIKPTRYRHDSGFRQADRDNYYEMLGSHPMTTETKMSYDEARKKCRCPYRQDLELLCFEDDCGKSDCPIYEKESGRLAQALTNPY